jgi:hypothetical protein
MVYLFFFFFFCLRLCIHGCAAVRHSKARLDAARGEVQALHMSSIEDVREGDYQVQVHVIEARDLAAVDLGGTSDPSIYVYIMGQKKRTRIISKVRW